jgi:GDP-4-dehydro-6-deoxy-D-mannose reductase
VGQDYLGYQYFKSFGTKVVRTRGFNHDGPRRGEVFVSSNFAKQLACIGKGTKPPVIHVGNLEARRDFTDVRDMVRAYWLALEHGEPGEVYNIASGRGYKIRDVLDILIGLAHANVEVREDAARLRPSDVEVLLGDCSRFRRVSGWEPTIPFDVTMKDLLDHWRGRV